jgi:hypothetical protein
MKSPSQQQWVSEWVSVNSVNIVHSVNKVVNLHKDDYHYVGGSPTYWWPRRDPTWSEHDNRSLYRRCRHYTTMILDHQKIIERTDNIVRWLANLTAERNHLDFRDCRSRSRDRCSNSHSRQDTANNFWPGTTNATETEHNVAPSTAPSTCKTN